MDNKERTGELLELYQTLKEERDPWEQDWREIAKFMLPKRSNFHDDRGRYTRVGGKVYDGTPIGAANTLANGLTGYLVSPGTQWFKLGLGDEELADYAPVRAFLDAAEAILYRLFHKSNFYEEIPQQLMDCGMFGTGVSFVGMNYKRKLPFYKSLHPKETYIAEDYEGRVDTMVRRFFPTLKELVQQFGIERFDENLKLMLEKTPMERIETLHVVRPRDFPNDRNNKGKKFESIYFLPSKQHILKESGFDHFPFPTARWSVNSDEVYGRGPGNDALSEVLKMNQVSKTMLKAAHMAVDPPLNVPEAQRNRVKWTPGGQNFYQNHDNRIYPMEMGVNYPVGIDRENKIRETIEKYFMVDFFMMLQNAPKGMTATEVVERQTEKSAVLTPIIGRIGSEMLDPLIVLTFDAASKLGMLPPPPPELAREGGNIEITYRGPLAQAQRRFHRSHGMRQALATFLPLLEVNPDLRDIIDWDGMARHNLIEEGLPAKHLKDELQVQQERKARAEQQMAMQQQQQQAEVMEKQGKAAKDFAQAESAQGIGQQLKGALGGGQ